MMLRVVVLVAAPWCAVVALGACEGQDRGSATATTATSAPGVDRRTPITITTTPPGATVLVDGAAVGSSPVVVPLNPGPHRLRATMSGYYPAQEQRFVVERGVAATHSVALVGSH
jgi:hypothetical protein